MICKKFILIFLSFFMIWLNVANFAFAAPGDADDDGYSDQIELSVGTDPFDSDSTPLDNDMDFIPDVIDDDDDNDGVLDQLDDFPFDDTEQYDHDQDGIGDNADLDDDNDGYSDLIEIAYETNPFSPFSYPNDFDEDLLPDQDDPDDDNDGVLDENDDYPFDPDESVDTDHDGVGDNTDTDDDNDGVLDAEDTFPFDQGEFIDTDGDGIGNIEDTDDDNDTVPDWEDQYPLDYNEWSDLDLDDIGDNADEDTVYYGCEFELDQFAMNFSNDIFHYQNQSCIINQQDNFELFFDSPAHIAVIKLWLYSQVNSQISISSLNADNNQIGDGFKIAIAENKLNRWIRIRFVYDVIVQTSYLYVDNNESFKITNLGNELIKGISVTTDAEQLYVDDMAYRTYNDFDFDGISDQEDTDDDNDGILDGEDEFSFNSGEWEDGAQDGIGDNADTDDDNDGITDEEEEMYGLDPLDMDSDDDGIIDGNEINPYEDTDSDGLINALDPDSDNDGIMDGTEIGLIEAQVSFQENLPPNLLATQRGSPYVVYDSDPTTVSSPIKADTDEGGLADGIEDLNHNGKYEPGERNILNASDDTLPNAFNGGGGGGGCSICFNNNYSISMFYLLLGSILLFFSIRRGLRLCGNSLSSSGLTRGSKLK